MTNLNLESYFTNQKLYHPQIIITIIEDITSKNFNQLKKDINNQKITITEEQIKKYLDKKFIEEEPEVKRRIELKHNSPTKHQEKQNIKAINIIQEFNDYVIASKYDFNPYVLEYFKKNSTIIKRKLNLLLNLIEKISIKDTTSIQNLLIDLDINLDSSGNISKDDIIRLIKPTIDNINNLDTIIKKANNLTTYLTITIPSTNLIENNIYSSLSLQNKSPFQDHLKGNIPLSLNQKNELKKKQRKNTNIIIKSILD